MTKKWQRDEVQERVIALIAEQLHKEIATITPESTLMSLGADSIDMVEFVIRVEDEFDIEIDDTQAEQLHTIGDVINYVAQQCAQ